MMFSLREPGSDGISYPIISHLGFAGELAFLQLINKSWYTATLFQSMGKIIIVPIPKPGKYQPIFLPSCLGKTAERMKNGTPHEHLHGFTRGMSTTHSITILLSTIYTTTSVVVFLDLEIAFELSSPLAIQESLIHKGIRGKLLAWVADYFKNRTANARYHGHLSQLLPLEDGTPLGGVLSATLFNLMSSILNIHPSEGCRIIFYADNMANIFGKRCLNRAQCCLDLVSEVLQDESQDFSNKLKSYGSENQCQENKTHCPEHGSGMS
ncbi:uncharacterized protein [Penaeus vannamei]|uniref:uncharacterized protein n=1 Tax=Penaeus vannamei TaxID=6689 RepID=UPI000F677B30|nr:uncharacterized protein LOC113811148 [Penaeus vannamei]